MTLSHDGGGVFETIKAGAVVGTGSVVVLPEAEAVVLPETEAEAVVLPEAETVALEELTADELALPLTSEEDAEVAD